MPSEPSSVLVVHDEPSIRKALRIALTANGFSVAEARHGDEAIGIVQRRRFDLVLLDKNMPGIGGSEVCRQIKEIAPHAGILMLTVINLEEDKVRALEAGADDYITKPSCFASSRPGFEPFSAGRGPSKLPSRKLSR